MTMRWGYDAQGPNPKPLKDCSLCEGKGQYEDYHVQEIKRCDCQSHAKFRRQMKLRSAKNDLRDAVRVLAALGVRVEITKGKIIWHKEKT